MLIMQVLLHASSTQCANASKHSLGDFICTIVNPIYGEQDISGGSPATVARDTHSFCFFEETTSASIMVMIGKRWCCIVPHSLHPNVAQLT